MRTHHLIQEDSTQVQAYLVTTVAEDFSYLSQEVPGVFYHLGGSKDGVDPATSPPNHSPEFDVNESILPLGVKTHVLSALRFLERE